jgi:hypothetical protein
MSYESPSESTASPASKSPPTTDLKNDADNPPPRAPSQGAAATVLVRGETLRDAGSNPASSTNQAPNANQAKPKAPKPISDAKVQLQGRLPGLADDADVGTQKDQIVTRDGKPDLAFTGTLLAAAAPATAPNGQWNEYRVYETSAGKHVFSKISRSIYVGDDDTHEADIFDPAPTSMPSQLLRSARDLVHSEPKTWQNAASDFFGYDPLAKELYRKLSGQFEERID